MWTAPEADVDHTRSDVNAPETDVDSTRERCVRSWERCGHPWRAM